MTRLSRTLGPGLLYAASAVGVSHLVQATRAGAEYGLALVGVMLVFGLVKYPAIRFGGEYTALAGESLLDRYARDGRAVVFVVVVLVALQMCFTFPAVLALTAGLVSATFKLSAPLAVVAAGLALPVAALVVIGRYRRVERVTSVLVVVLAGLVVVATLLVAHRVPVSAATFVPPSIDAGTVFFCLALAGFMPTPVDGALLASVWVDARRRAGGRVVGPEARRDFDIGYFGSLALGVAFMVLGTAVMFGTGTSFAPEAPRFSGQVLDLFTAAVGPWVFPLIAAAALAVMLTTVLALADGLPRVMTRALELAGAGRTTPSHRILTGIQAVVAVAVIHFLIASFTTFIDVVTFASFLASPVLAWLNHRAMFGRDAPEGGPGRAVERWSLASAVVLTGISLAWVVARVVL